MQIQSKEIIENRHYDQERSLYNLTATKLVKCEFKSAEGESPLKEARDIVVENCLFAMRYPLWHTKGLAMTGTIMEESTRAPLWYVKNGTINNLTLHGTKAIRECHDIKITDSKIVSDEFGWKSSKISVENSQIQSEYLFLDSTHIDIKNIEMKGKYSFQYTKHVTIDKSHIDTKDAFWHCDDVVIIDSVITGEYFAWYSKHLTLINCKISGSQPLCYCKNLKLIDCEMVGCDLAFEYSDVEADIKGRIDSIKNPKRGHIVVDSYGEVIHDNTAIPCKGKVILRENNNHKAK